jgi:hypothetical protein
MTLGCQDTIAAGEGRTQGGQIAALFARPRTLHRASQHVVAAVVSFFSSLPALSEPLEAFRGQLVIEAIPVLFRYRLDGGPDL